MFLYAAAQLASQPPRISSLPDSVLLRLLCRSRCALVLPAVDDQLQSRSAESSDIVKRHWFCIASSACASLLPAYDCWDFMPFSQSTVVIPKAAVLTRRICSPASIDGTALRPSLFAALRPISSK